MLWIKFIDSGDIFVYYARFILYFLLVSYGFFRYYRSFISTLALTYCAGLVYFIICSKGLAYVVTFKGSAYVVTFKGLAYIFTFKGLIYAVACEGLIDVIL